MKTQYDLRHNIKGLIAALILTALPLCATKAAEYVYLFGPYYAGTGVIFYVPAMAGQCTLYSDAEPCPDGHVTHKLHHDFEHYHFTVDLPTGALDDDGNPITLVTKDDVSAYWDTVYWDFYSRTPGSESIRQNCFGYALGYTSIWINPDQVEEYFEDDYDECSLSVADLVVAEDLSHMQRIDSRFGEGGIPITSEKDNCSAIYGKVWWYGLPAGDPLKKAF
jgi:hypothetical protein